MREKEMIHAMHSLNIDNNTDSMDVDEINQHQLYLATVYTPSRYKQQFYLQFTISRKTKGYVHGQALLDCGASRSFMSKIFAEINRIPTIPLKKTMTVYIKLMVRRHPTLYQSRI
ncbi:hypothetical protein SeMB42_g02819 [Synchytrium endobioticum]|uniref:Uncharacterized protein n=1 Tax=Synchytrium endobioticum TaxID=286115 RepID=A0A507DDC5_9FUNG|nr:hypothetical protein SeMB42_g02819 [Synchytrium endobioticum]